MECFHGMFPWNVSMECSMDVPLFPPFFYRTHKKVLESIRMDVSQGIKPAKIWLKHLNPMNTAESARSYRQVIDAKSKHNRDVLGIRGNTCDDVIKIITERQYKLQNSIQRTFGATREREIPSVACWRPWHMITIPNVCRWDTMGVVLGEDITFNLVRKLSSVTTRQHYDTVTLLHYANDTVTLITI